MGQVAKDFLQTKLGKKFVPVLIWADRMTKDSVNSPIKPPGRRAIAYANAIAIAYAYAISYAISYANALAISYAYAYTYAYTVAIANVNAYVYGISNAKLIEALITLAELFQQDQIFSTVNYQPLSTTLREEQDFWNTKPQLTLEEFQERIKEIFQVWNQTFSLTPDLLNFEYGEIYNIDHQYFYIYRLILDCQKIAPNLAPGVWAEIENGMLLP
jgi:hypothetical protein